MLKILLASNLQLTFPSEVTSAESPFPVKLIPNDCLIQGYKNSAIFTQLGITFSSKGCCGVSWGLLWPYITAWLLCPILLLSPLLHRCLKDTSSYKSCMLNLTLEETQLGMSFGGGGACGGNGGRGGNGPRLGRSVCSCRYCSGGQKHQQQCWVTFSVGQRYGWQFCHQANFLA